MHQFQPIPSLPSSTSAFKNPQNPLHSLPPNPPQLLLVLHNLQSTKQPTTHSPHLNPLVPTPPNPPNPIFNPPSPLPSTTYISNSPHTIYNLQSPRVPLPPPTPLSLTSLLKNPLHPLSTHHPPSSAQPTLLTPVRIPRYSRLLPNRRSHSPSYNIVKALHIFICTFTLIPFQYSSPC